MVTAVLGDYRGFDTMLETSVVLVAGLALVLLMRTFVAGGGEKEPRIGEVEDEEGESSVIVQTTCKLLIPPIQIFSLYVLFHGHYSPGGGFQGGVMFGAALILYAIAFDLKSALQRFRQSMQLLCASDGVLIYAGIGTLCLFYGGKFLDYSVLAELLHMTPVYARSYGILGVEIGVGITVTAVMFSLYADLASGGKLDKGL